MTPEKVPVPAVSWVVLMWLVPEGHILRTTGLINHLEAAWSSITKILCKNAGVVVRWQRFLWILCKTLG